MAYWAKPGLNRFETRLFTPTPDESVDDNHPVRHLDEILRGMDWSDWTAQYNGRVGQPPIPPWVMAGVILYGLMRRVRSSRQGSEDADAHVEPANLLHLPDEPAGVQMTHLNEIA